MRRGQGAGASGGCGAAVSVNAGGAVEMGSAATSLDLLAFGFRGSPPCVRPCITIVSNQKIVCLLCQIVGASHRSLNRTDILSFEKSGKCCSSLDFQKHMMEHKI